MKYIAIIALCNYVLATAVFYTFILLRDKYEVYTAEFNKRNPRCIYLMWYLFASIIAMVIISGIWGKK